MHGNTRRGSATQANEHAVPARAAKPPKRHGDARPSGPVTSSAHQVNFAAPLPRPPGCRAFLLPHGQDPPHHPVICQKTGSSEPDRERGRCGEGTKEAGEGHGSTKSSSADTPSQATRRVQHGGKRPRFKTGSSISAVGRAGRCLSPRRPPRPGPIPRRRGGRGRWARPSAQGPWLPPRRPPWVGGGHLPNLPARPSVAEPRRGAARGWGALTCAGLRRGHKRLGESWRRSNPAAVPRARR